MEIGEINFKDPNIREDDHKRTISIKIEKFEEDLENGKEKKGFIDEVHLKEKLECYLNNSVDKW
jgi:hypothetical protein